MDDGGAQTRINTRGTGYLFTKHPRAQDIIEVNRHELSELAEADWLCQAQIMMGQFFLSGALWLGLEKALDRPDGEPLWTSLFALCVGGAFGGLILLCFGVLAWRSKARKVKNIFDEVIIVESGREPEPS